jgi:hypothetical protein
MAFREGDLVTVRPADRIRESLDTLNRRGGCLFHPPMYKYCGDRRRVVKVVRNVFDEGTRKMNILKSPMYLLEGTFCDGASETLRDRCDR